MCTRFDCRCSSNTVLASLVFPLFRLTPQLRGARSLHHLVQGSMGLSSLHSLAPHAAQCAATSCRTPSSPGSRRHWCPRGRACWSPRWFCTSYSLQRLSTHPRHPRCVQLLHSVGCCAVGLAVQMLPIVFVCMLRAPCAPLCRGQRTCFGTPCQAIIIVLPRLNAVPAVPWPT